MKTNTHSNTANSKIIRTITALEIHPAFASTRVSRTKEHTQHTGREDWDHWDHLPERGGGTHTYCDQTRHVYMMVPPGVRTFPGTGITTCAAAGTGVAAEQFT